MKTAIKIAATLALVPFAMLGCEKDNRPSTGTSPSSESSMNQGGRGAAPMGGGPQMHDAGMMPKSPYGAGSDFGAEPNAPYGGGPYGGMDAGVQNPSTGKHHDAGAHYLPEQSQPRGSSSSGGFGE